MIEFNDFDRCPACKKKCKNLFPDGKLLMTANLVICPRCGNGFLPRSMVQSMYGHKDDVIIKPGQGAISAVGHG